MALTRLETMVTTNNQQTVDINHISDRNVRDTLLVIVRELEDLKKTVRTAGSVTGKDFRVTSGLASVLESGVLEFTALRNIRTVTSRIGSEKISQVKFAAYSGSLPASTSEDITVDGQVIGAFGWTSFNGYSTSATAQWNPMEIGGATTAVYMATTSSSRYDKVRLTNSDGANTNRYKIMVFYTD